MINIKEDKCDFCSTCITVCPTDCIEVRENSINISHDLCIDCNLCINICPIEVLSSNEKKL